MSEKIIAANLDEVIQKNRAIHSDIVACVDSIRANFNELQFRSSSQQAIHLLKLRGLIQIPLDNQYWSGAIFVKNEKRIPVLNTALPRANQYFAAWHEIYHLLFDKVSFNHVIETEATMEERKAEHFASLMLLGSLLPYYNELPPMDFVSKVFHCMDAFQAPYKAVLIALYESAQINCNEPLMKEIKQNFDRQFTDLNQRFRELGLDDSLVEPSNLINFGMLEAKIQARIAEDPELQYHHDNSEYLQKIMKEIVSILRL